MWLAEGAPTYVHGNRWAPRCLPCNYTDPLSSKGPAIGFNAKPVSGRHLHALVTVVASWQMCPVLHQAPSVFCPMFRRYLFPVNILAFKRCAVQSSNHGLNLRP